MPVGILIADDHAVFRCGLKALLEREPDLRVTSEAGTGADAIEKAGAREVDLLILDLSLPDMPGSAVAESVLRERPDLPIVVLTMHEDEYYLQEMLRIGVRAFILKKSTGTDLLHAIRAVLGGKQHVDPSLAGALLASYVGQRPDRRRAGAIELLTSREREICGLLAYGHTNAEIAASLCLSTRTVETHRTNIMAKLDLKGRAALVRFAIDHGLMKVR